MRIEDAMSAKALQMSFLNLREEIASNAVENKEAPSFFQVMQRAVESVDADQLKASEMMSAVDAGRSDDLVGAMVASQKAGLSFSALVQVRNKLVSAFDDIMRMPL